MSPRPRSPRPPAAPPPAAFGDHLADFAPLSPAEMKLKEACRTGDVAIFGDERPEERDEARLIRAAVLRVFCLGRDPAAPVHAHGIWVVGAWIAGDLDLAGVTVPHPVDCSRCHIDGTVVLRDASTRQLVFDGSSCVGIYGDGIDVRGDLFLQELDTTGTIRLMGATIGGNLDCSGATFAEGIGYALSCDGAEITGDVFLKNGFTAHREVRLLGATIGGNLDCSGATLAEGEGDALACDRAQITGSVFLNYGFTAHREVRLLGATIGGNLECSGAKFPPGKSHALSCDRAQIAGSVSLTGGFTAHRAVRFPSATIGGDLVCRDGRFEAALILDKATVSGTLFLDGAFGATGVVDLASATVGDLRDIPAAWIHSTWVLDGLTYRRITGKAPTDAAARIRWLDRQFSEHLTSDFRPQPWEHCAEVLAAMGHEADAVHIRIEKRRRMRPLPLHRAKTGDKKRRLTAAVVHAFRRRSSAALCAVPTALATYGAALVRKGLVRLGMASDFLLCVTVGYGWRPQWALAWLILLWGLTAGLHAGAVPKGVMAPTDALVYQSPAIPAECKADWVGFDPPLRGDHDAAQISAARAVGLLATGATASPACVPEWKEICSRAMPAEYTTFSPWVYVTLPPGMSSF